MAFSFDGAQAVLAAGESEKSSMSSNCDVWWTRRLEKGEKNVGKKLSLWFTEISILDD